MQVNAFKCPHCGTTMSQGMGPNWTQVTDAPQARGGSVIMLSCLNPDCQASLGAYLIPPPPAGS
jgi:hypothetical protein